MSREREREKKAKYQLTRSSRATRARVGLNINTHGVTLLSRREQRSHKYPGGIDKSEISGRLIRARAGKLRARVAAFRLINPTLNVDCANDDISPGRRVTKSRPPFLRFALRGRGGKNAHAAAVTNRK